jgi:hypothetical protein
VKVERFFSGGGPSAVQKTYFDERWINAHDFVATAKRDYLEMHGGCKTQQIAN